MGHWGFNYEESDTYLDILDSVFDPIEEIINSEEFYIEQYIAASGLLSELMETGNLNYHGYFELISTAIKVLSNLLLDKTNFTDWKPNDEKRMEAVSQLVIKLKSIEEKGSRSTSLGNKMFGEENE